VTSGPPHHLAAVLQECLDHLLITGPPHLVAVLQEFIEHYNTHRPHRLLDQHPPAGSTPLPSGPVIHPLRRDRLGGLVHEYVQVA
jgi:putative transposase